MNKSANNSNLVKPAKPAPNTKGENKLHRKLLPALIASCFACGPVYANPTSPTVVNGQVTIVNNGNTLTITNTPGSIINWTSFSINPGELTQFLQQNSSSAVLNRITGQSPSQIFGALQSNGKVFLINPNGVMFGANSRVNVAGLVASTLDISNSDFATGKLNFAAGSTAGSIVNQGSLVTPSGGQIYLIAPQVQNSGIINSPQGEVLLAAGRSVQLVDGADPNIQIVVSAPTDQALNLGNVVAQGGKIGIYGALVNQNGVVNADSAVVGQNGEIVFKSSQTTILSGNSQTSAAGAGEGGNIYLLGPQVGLTDAAMVNAGGNTGGGTILVGGDYHGQNPNIENAKAVYVGAGTTLSADAVQKGNGGKVIVWSDNATRSYGTISAKGGAQNGDGGFVENSSGKNMDFRASVNVSAPHGKGGTLLLDPSTITIVGDSGDGGSDGTGTFQGSSTPGTVNFADANPTQIYQSEIQGISAGTNVVLEATDYITTSGSFTGAGAGGTLLIPVGSNLTLTTRNASTDGTGTKGIDLTGGGTTTNLIIQTQQGGGVTLQTGTGASPQAADIQAVAIVTGGGGVTMSASGNVVTRGVNTYTVAGNSGSVSLSAGGFLTVGATIDAHAASG